MANDIQNTDALRRAFLTYFEAQGHQVVASSSLLPMGDPTLLFVNAGMVQFKDCFLGTEKRSYQRAVTCQKCIRISGKHNDLENVGRTARHHTFFEMLGNFSFGDYFKENAIIYAWEFLTLELALPVEHLWITVFEDDDEAAQIWQNKAKVKPERILRCGAKDNFWAMGETGPCGPCSEIHYYLGQKPEKQTEADFRREDGSFLEIWNLVFMQFNRDTAGNLNPLPKPSVDTGMGLERIASVLQGKQSNYETDSLYNLIRCMENLSHNKYQGLFKTDNESELQILVSDTAMRVAVDHARAAAFLIADGVQPGSEGRGYVLRRLIRRAVKHGRTLNLNEPFLWQVALEVVKTYQNTYPELIAAQDLIKRLIQAEEDRFLKTIDAGLILLENELAKRRASGDKRLSGKLAFTLHDTYGFPLDLTEDITSDVGLSVDRREFEIEMENQRERSRSARASETALILQRSVKPSPTKFLGYQELLAEAQLIAIYDQTGEVKIAHAGDEVALVFSETPFYAESGGQVGDTGIINATHGSLEVLDTQKVHTDTIVHFCKIIEGEVAHGQLAQLAVNAARRERIRVNHSATHLLHMALREVLGDHIRQAGSRVSDYSLRFDFSHPEAVTQANLREIERIVSEAARANFQIITHEDVPIEAAKKMGAIALFGEKYGERVRVVEIGPASREFCGGTHASRSGDIGFITIEMEGSVAAGVRRIEAHAGEGATATLLRQHTDLYKLSTLLAVGRADLSERVEKLIEAHRSLEKDVNKLKQQSNIAKGAQLILNATNMSKGGKLVAEKVDISSPKEMRELADDLKARLHSGCVALASEKDGKALLLIALTDDLIGTYDAGKLLAEISPILGIRGGGRADLAQAGGGDPSKINEALGKLKEVL